MCEQGGIIVCDQVGNKCVNRVAIYSVIRLARSV